MKKKTTIQKGRQQKLRMRMERIKNYLQNFMRGRYGIDQMSQAMFIAALVLILLAGFSQNLIFELLGIALFVYADYRALSRNISARRAENARYEEAIRNIKEKIHPSGADATHRVYICPNKSCGQKIRVPKGKGKIEITCPKCGQKFVKRT